MLHNIPLGILAARKITYSFTASGKSNADTASYTLTSASIGTATADRIVVVSVVGVGDSTHSVTIGGNAATEVISYAGTSGRASLYALSVPTGTTANVVVTVGGTDSLGVSVYAMYGASGTTAHDTATANADPLTTTIDIPAGGVVFAVADAYNASALTFAWTGVDEDVNLGPLSAGQDHGAMASRTYAAQSLSTTITCDPSLAVSERAMAVVSFGP